MTTTLRRESGPRRPVESRRQLTTGWFRVLTAVVVVQGLHVFEHVVQLVQVFVIGTPDDDALGFLGFVFEFQGTEEWLHLGFNLVYLAGIWFLVLPLWRATPAVIPLRSLAIFVLAAATLQTWHGVEHIVIIAQVAANGGCPCPGVLDAALGVTDTVLHFFYNSLTYAGVLVPFRWAWRART